MKILHDFLSALAFLTTLPVRSKSDWQDHGKILFFPAVGLVIGLILVAGDSLVGIHLNIAARSFISVLLLVLLTGGLHLDGLADAFDGLFSHRDRDRMLEIMKDTRTGTYGVISLVVILGAKWIGLASVMPDHRIWYLIMVPVFSRTAMMLMLTYSRYARKEGEGLAPKWFDAEPGCLHFLIVLAVLITAISWNTYAGIAALVITVFVMAWWGYVCTKKIGGMTGDTLGAGNEMIEAVLFFSAAVV